MAETLSKFGVRLIPNPPLRDQAYATLKDAILSGKLQPGDRLVEREIADSLGLSRSPVREAFRRLEQEGYLRVARAGIVVQELSHKDIQDLYFLRQRLEGLACSLAAERVSDEEIERLRHSLNAMENAVKERNQKKILRAGYEFHNQLYTLSDNKYLIETLTALAEQARRFRSLNVTIHQRGRDALEEHRQVVEAIARHDARAADRLSQEHVNRSWENTQKSLAQNESK